MANILTTKYNKLPAFVVHYFMGLKFDPILLSACLKYGFVLLSFEDINKNWHVHFACIKKTLKYKFHTVVPCYWLEMIGTTSATVKRTFADYSQPQILFLNVVFFPSLSLQWIPAAAAMPGCFWLREQAVTHWPLIWLKRCASSCRASWRVQTKSRWPMIKWWKHAGETTSFCLICIVIDCCEKIPFLSTQHIRKEILKMFWPRILKIFDEFGPLTYFNIPPFLSSSVLKCNRT